MAQALELTLCSVRVQQLHSKAPRKQQQRAAQPSRGPEQQAPTRYLGGEGRHPQLAAHQKAVCRRKAGVVQRGRGRHTPSVRKPSELHSLHWLPRAHQHGFRQLLTGIKASHEGLLLLLALPACVGSRGRNSTDCGTSQLEAPCTDSGSWRLALPRALGTGATCTEPSTLQRSWQPAQRPSTARCRRRLGPAAHQQRLPSAAHSSARPSRTPTAP